MIIHSISARNILKYEQLELQDLPKEGVIAISGFNESGKSTIGETICFALFGRTFSVDENHLDKIIRWGESDCSVTIRFSNHKVDSPEDEQYAITRMLDCDGNHSAKLYKVYNEDNPLARGIERVEEALFELTAVEYEEFIESFYLAQREITTPHPHSYALKTMAGIATMEYCDSEIHEDIEQDTDAAEALTHRVSEIAEEQDAMEIDEGHLVSLKQQHDVALEDKKRVDETLADYQNAVEGYQEMLPKLRYCQSKKAGGSFWRFTYLVIALVAFGLWWVLAKMPDSIPYELLHNYLQAQWPSISAEHYVYLLYTGGGTVFMFLLFWFAVINQKGHIQRLNSAGSELAEKIRALDEETAASADEAREKQIALIATSQLQEQPLAELTDPDIARLTKQQEQLVEQISELAAKLAVEGERVKHSNELQDKINDLQGQILAKTERNKIRELASELLGGATRHLSKRFNHIIRDHVGKTLPLFTENRYEHLQIDEDLTVRVFSNEKHDFMELDEISSGTQRQIMLAVRLALSQEMVSRKVHSQQFLILDEPFAFFDEERTERSLSVLPELSDDLPQIWIIAQSFPEKLSFEHSIYCEREVVAKIS